MSKKDLLDLLNWQNQTIGGRRLLFILCVGLAISAIIFVTYRLTYNGVSYNAKFNVSNSVILLITIVIMTPLRTGLSISSMTLWPHPSRRII
jgi:hypothetical protein